MISVKPTPADAKATNTVVPLPKQVVSRDQPVASTAPSWMPLLRRLRFVPLVMGLIMLGGIIGLYFQPPGLRKVFEVLKIQPGGGT